MSSAGGGRKNTIHFRHAAESMAGGGEGWGESTAHQPVSLHSPDGIVSAADTHQLRRAGVPVETRSNAIARKIHRKKKKHKKNSSLWWQRVRSSESQPRQDPPRARAGWAADVFGRWLDAAEGYKAAPPRNQEERM